MAVSEKLPLSGRTIIVTRAQEQAGDFTAKLAEKGADIICFPTIQILPPASWKPVDRILKRLGEFDWTVFTSVNGVESFFSRMMVLGIDLREMFRVRIAAIGSETASCLKKNRVIPDLVPADYSVDGLLSEFRKMEKIRDSRFLLFRAAKANPLLAQGLKNLGAEVEEAIGYRTEKSNMDPDVLIHSGKKIDCVTFTSSSTVENFFKIVGDEKAAMILENTACACIGPRTKKTLENKGINVRIESNRYTAESLLESIVLYFLK
jgi:uroporphyrinogen III methyltransferase/synthase